jgi:inhibitor of cysteine peptidase
MTNRAIMWSLWICSLVMICVACLLLGCGSSTDETIANPEVDREIGMETFESNASLKNYILDQYAGSVLPGSAYGPSWESNDAPTEDAPAPDGAGDSGETVEDDYSETNVQEQGVDEADKVKNDGRYIYLTGEQSVHIVDSDDPSAMRAVSTIEVNGHVDSLYLYNNLLVIIYIPLNGEGHYWDYAAGTGPIDFGFCYWLPVNTETGVMLVDISDPSFPLKTNDIIIEGNLISTRRIENKLYIVQQFLPELPQIDYYYDDNQDKDAAVKANKAKLKNIGLEEVIPFYRTVDENGIESESTQLVPYNHFYKPSQASGGSIVTITTCNLDDPSGAIVSSGVIADAHTIYASTNSLYLASTRWNYSAYKDNDFADIYRTYLFKFNFTTDGVACTGTGSVNGKILNQFSLGEYEDALRIATTNGEPWLGDGNISSNVFCLMVKNEILKVIGKIENIAEGESIYAVRFIGQRGYLVTFVKVDPLFTLDLLDPYHPKIVGELKVPGYSDYIHPLSDDYLLTIGKDVALFEGTAWYQGIRLSLFDVRDFNNPILLDTEIIGDRGTHSEALYDHKAFTYWTSNNLLAIPIDLYEITSPRYPYDYGEYQYSGLFVYRIAIGGGFTHLGTIRTNHLEYDYSTPWTRGLFINDHVFAVEQNAVHSAEYNAINTTTSTLNLIP